MEQTGLRHNRRPPAWFRRAKFATYTHQASTYSIPNSLKSNTVLKYYMSFLEQPSENISDRDEHDLNNMLIVVT